MPRAMIIRLLLSIALLLIAAHRLPAPISEEASPTPAEQSAKPKPKRTIKSTDSREGSEVSTKRQTSPKPQIQRTPNSTPFVGTWSGTMNISFFGDIGYTFLIDPAQATVKMCSAAASANARNRSEVTSLSFGNPNPDDAGRFWRMCCICAWGRGRSMLCLCGRKRWLISMANI